MNIVDKLKEVTKHMARRKKKVVRKEETRAKRPETNPVVDRDNAVDPNSPAYQS